MMEVWESANEAKSILWSFALSLDGRNDGVRTRARKASAFGVGQAIDCIDLGRPCMVYACKVTAEQT